MEDRINDPFFESRFNNWIRWARGSHAPRSVVCMSLESNYIAEAITDDDATGWGDWEQPRRAVTVPAPPINRPDAVLLNAAFATLPQAPRKAIKLYYFRPYLQETWIARKLGVHILELGFRLRISKQAHRSAVARLCLDLESPRTRATIRGAAF